MSWLVRDGIVLAAAEIAVDRRARRRGLLGRDDIEGAFILRPCRQVHTFGMRFAIDVAFVDELGIVRRMVTMATQRVSRPVVGGAFVIEARAGAFARWDLRVGDQVEVKE